MPHIVLVHATFQNAGDAAALYNHVRSVATNASVARIGEPGERTSWAAHYIEDAEGNTATEAQWHIDRFGILRDGLLVPDTEVPDWIQPSGAQDAYPASDVHGEPTRVLHNGQVWQNSHGAANTWAPGVFGWTLV